MVHQQMSIVEQLAAQAIRLGADTLEVEYKDGYEEVLAAQGGLGYGIAQFRSSSREAVSLRKELYGITKQRRRLTVDNCEYELRGRVYESFGEDAFRVELRRVGKSARVRRRDG
jgi:hypothetical protein